MTGAALALLALACSPNPAQQTPGAARATFATFPSVHLLDDQGNLDIPSDQVPTVEGGLPWPSERLTWRAGFSPVQTAVIDPEVALDGDSLPATDLLGVTGAVEADSVQVWDLTAGLRVPAMAELDAWCATLPEDQEDEACQVEVPRLLVRPLQPVADGHRVAVVVTTAVRDAEGQPWQGPAWWRDLRAGRPHAELERWQDHYDDLVEDLAALGLDEPALAFDYPVADGSVATRAVASQAEVPTGLTWTRSAEADLGDSLPPRTWKQAEGTFLANDWLVEDTQFALLDGVPQLQGQVEVDLYVHLPASVATAPDGSAPVWILGHGIFSEPDDYLGQDDDPSGVLELADRAGAIVVATTWRGLTADDLLTAVNVGNDLSRFPELTDKLAQGVANTVALRRLVTEGGLLDDPLFQGKADPSTLRYYGISLGGIEGAVLLALDPAIPHGVLHVGGSTWSTMLERSSNWPVFEDLVAYGHDSPADRQLLYALTQLFWDQVDPASYVDELTGRSVLWQESIGDEQVPNLTTESLARGVGATLLAPSVSPVHGLDSAEGPFRGPALVQFDPQVGVPPDQNRPAEVSGAHAAPRLWNGTMEQVLHFLDPTTPGEVLHFCGEAPCAADNPG
ncbi:hypothetical protein L6R53_10375 [Myxococcota bacterium]|nr:hypothetical protein [Myxococcota bacterium]